MKMIGMMPLIFSVKFSYQGLPNQAKWVKFSPYIGWSRSPSSTERN